MKRIDLTEWTRTPEPERLTTSQRDRLAELRLDLTIEPALGESDAYHLKPSSTVGALDVGDLSVSIQPKLPIGRVLYLASYAMGAVDFREEHFDFHVTNRPW